jgi:ribosomal protein S12 methylthiotransferase
VKPRRVVSLVSLGCPKNLVDSEGLVSKLLSSDFRVVSDPADSDVAIVNTCGFLQASRKESIATIREVCDLKKKRNGVRGVLVAGCMVGNYGDELLKEVPEVDRLVGFGEYDRIAEFVEALLPRQDTAGFHAERRRIDASLTPRHYAYLKISEGCNRICSFCVIPSIRGKMRSVPVDDLVARARVMAERGVREISLIAQDSTVYGADLYGAPKLEELLDRLDEVEGLSWVRLMYAYPTEVTEGLMDRLGSGARILPYLDVPVQHASDAVLRRMKRGYDRRTLDRMIGGLRRRGIAIRTTVIVGFPGETDADFEQLLDLVRASEFDRLGAFRYSQEEGSAAGILDAQVPDAVKDERFHRLMEAQQEIAFRRALAAVGTVEPVLIDVASTARKPARGRTRRDAPEVDAQVLVRGPGLEPGQLVDAEIVGAEGYDLVAKLAVRPRTPAARR